MTPATKVNPNAHILVGSGRIDMVIRGRQTGMTDRRGNELIDGDMVFCFGVHPDPIIVQIRLIMPDSMSPYWGIAWRENANQIAHTGMPQEIASNEHFGVEKV